MRRYAQHTFRIVSSENGRPTILSFHPYISLYLVPLLHAFHAFASRLWWPPKLGAPPPKLGGPAGAA